MAVSQPTIAAQRKKLAQKVAKARGTRITRESRVSLPPGSMLTLKLRDLIRWWVISAKMVNRTMRESTRKGLRDLLFSAAGSLLAALILTGLSWGKVSPSIAAYIVLVGIGSFFWGRYVGQTSLKPLLESAKQDKETLQKQLKHEYEKTVEKYEEESALLKTKAIHLSIIQPKGITFFPKSSLLRLHLYIKTATPLQSKDPQAVLNESGRTLVFKADGTHTIPISKEGTKGSPVPLERIIEPAEREAVETLIRNLVQTHKDVAVIVSPHLRGDDITDVFPHFSFNTFIEITS